VANARWVLKDRRAAALKSKWAMKGKRAMKGNRTQESE
jgi:hypothetical protein